MKNHKRSTFALSILIALLCVTGCSRAPKTTFNILTTDGDVLSMTCPVVRKGDFVSGGYCYINN